MSSYDINKWQDHGNYYIYEDDQRTIGWRQARMGRVTGSIINSCAFGSSYKLEVTTQEDMAKIIAGIKDKEISQEAQDRMDYGTNHEIEARNWYSITNDVIVKEMGFAVPKFDRRIGTSPDGIVYSKADDKKPIGMIEIKCPKEFYKPLKEYLDKGKPQTIYYYHIWRSHYDQMQMGMAIFDLEWCDYIVYCIPENYVFMERVYRDRGYWNELYIRVKEFIDTLLKPLLDQVSSPYPFLPKIHQISGS